MGFEIHKTPIDFIGYQVNPDILIYQGVSTGHFSEKYDEDEDMYFFAQGTDRSTNLFTAIWIKFKMGPLSSGRIQGITQNYRVNVYNVTQFVRERINTNVAGIDRSNTKGGKEFMFMQLKKNMCYYNNRIGQGSAALVIRVCEIDYKNSTDDLNPAFANIVGIC